ncbi:MAG TPA: stalk domain-containing protein [Paludibacter sp.]|nr:stalk domain-containing protein [Paludibacter sp.]
MNQFKKTAFITLCILTMPFAFGGNDWVFADTSDGGTSNIDISDVGVYIDGTEVDFPDAKPYISNSRTLVPVRFVVEQLDASIDWDNDTGTVSINKEEDSIELVIGSTEMVRNGVSSAMDVAPVISDSRTMVPVRFVSEQLGALVEWDIEKNSAMLTTEKQEPPVEIPEEGDLIVSTEAIDFDITYERTDSLYRGESEIINAGATGMIMLVGTKTPAVTRGEGEEISLGCSADEMITYAKEYLGVPYLYNGTTPDGFDCSGFTQYVMAHFGGILPHSSGDQYYYGISVEREDLEPGDLVFFEASDNPMEIGHVGIYIGDGEFIHAPQAGENVKITNLSNVYFAPRFYGAIRMDIY